MVLSTVDVSQPDANRRWDPGGAYCATPNAHVRSMIAAFIDEATDMQTGPDGDDSRTDLDSHANMPVVGKAAYVLEELGRRCEVSPYTPDYPPMTVPLVHAAVKYESPFDGRVYILLIRNALHVPSMAHNLIPPFMVREAGVQLREVPKIHVEDPSEDDHAIVFPDGGL